MNIEKIDKNFKKDRVEETGGKLCYTVPCEGFDLYGVFYDEKRGLFMRMDGDVASRVSPGVSYLASYTSGGRLRFKTDSSVIGISVAYDALCNMPHMPLTGSSGFALLEKVGSAYKNVCVFRPNPDEKSGYTGEVKVNGGIAREYVLYFPLYNSVKELKIYLDPASSLYEPEKYRDIAPVLYYGASIDQGGCASRPDSSYPAILSKWNDIDFINLGFSGNCMGEQLMAEYLTGIECSMLFMAYDGNAPDAAFLEKTHYPFYQTYRKVKKNIPVVFMSVPCFETFAESPVRRNVLYDSYLKARAAGDENVYFIDGETLFGDRDREICTVEGVHPNDLGFYRMAQVIYKTFGIIGAEFL